jgi:hypothetical protein
MAKSIRPGSKPNHRVVIDNNPLLIHRMLRVKLGKTTSELSLNDAQTFFPDVFQISTSGKSVSEIVQEINDCGYDWESPFQ